MNPKKENTTTRTKNSPKTQRPNTPQLTQKESKNKGQQRVERKEGHNEQAEKKKPREAGGDPGKKNAIYRSHERETNKRKDGQGRMKKIYALMLAIVMAMFATTAFAAEVGAIGTVGSADSPAGNSVTIKKNISVTNYAGYAYEPTITYNYSLQDGPDATSTKTVTDSSDPAVTASFKKGLTTYLASTDTAAKSVVYSSTNAATATEKDLTWTFDPSAFPSAGVYRFIVTETSTSVAPASIGIVRPANYDTSKFLDVYVQNGTYGLEIYGYALVDDETTSVTSTSTKSQGWNSGDDLDSYTTYNITITKTISGGGADMSAKFPFTVALSGEMSNANIAVETSGGTNLSTWALTEGANLESDTATVTANLGNTNTLTIKGLPTTVSYTVAEANPTYDTYTATVTVTTGTGTAVGGSLTPQATSLSLVSGGTVTGSSAIAIGVENHLDVISPTGYVTRFAPYALILAAGVVLLIVAKKHKKNTDED